MTLSGASLLDQLSAVEESGFDAIQKARNPDMLEVARVHYLGRNGQLADAMALIADVPSNARREVGQRANAVKKGLTAALEQQA